VLDWISQADHTHGADNCWVCWRTLVPLTHPQRWHFQALLACKRSLALRAPILGLRAPRGCGDSSPHPWPKERFGTEAWLLGPDDNRLLLLVLP
jgi:hypothetical protein